MENIRTMEDKIKNYLGYIIIAIIIILVILPFAKLPNRTYHFDYIIIDTIVKVIDKKHNEFGVKTITSSNTIGGGKYHRSYSSTSSYQTVYNTYMFIYKDGTVEEVDKIRYDIKNKNDTINILYYKYYISKNEFDNYKGVKIKQVFVDYLFYDFYEVKYINNKPTDTIRK